MSSPGESDIDDDDFCDISANFIAKAAELSHYQSAAKLRGCARARGDASVVRRARSHCFFNWQRALSSCVDARFISVAITFQLEPRTIIKYTAQSAHPGWYRRTGCPCQIEGTNISAINHAIAEDSTFDGDWEAPVKRQGPDAFRVICSQASFSARICRRSVCLKSEVVLGPSLSSYMHLNQRSTASWRGLFFIKRTYVSRRVRTRLFFAAFLVLEFIAWIICRSRQRHLPARLTNTVKCESVWGVCIQWEAGFWFRRVRSRDLRSEKFSLL